MNGKLTVFRAVTPALDIYEEKDKVVIKAALPGMDLKDVKVKLTANMVTISGEQGEEREIEEPGYYLKETRYGSFERTASLPVAVDPKKAKKKMQAGVLTITVPQKKKATKKKETVKRKTTKKAVSKKTQKRVAKKKK